MFLRNVTCADDANKTLLQDLVVGFPSLANTRHYQFLPIRKHH